jgi:hypothetical protein
MTLNGLHSVISQKIVLFITTAPRTSNPTLMHLAQDRDQWQGLVNTVMNLQVPPKTRNSMTS